MKKISILCISIFLVATTFAQESKISEEIMNHIQARVEVEMNVGIVVAMIDGEDVAYSKWGKTAYSQDAKIDEHSVLEIGSVSKVFTTILLSDMVLKGAMKLTDPISKYLPSSVTVPSRNDKQITLQDLATHTSGLPRMPSNFTPSNPNDPFSDYTVEQIYGFLSSYELTRDIGVQYEYSNYGMGLLGHILELQSGKSYEELIHDIIAKPLGMDHTGLALTEAMTKRLAIGHLGTNEVSNWNIITLGGAGGIRSSATDMVKFVQANMGVIKSPLMKAMTLSHQSAYKATDSEFELGLGWHYENDKKVVWHNGQTGGYASFIGFLAGTQKGVVVLTNSAENITALGFKLLGSPTPLAEIQKGMELDPEILESYVGKYQLAPNFFITVTTNDGKIYGQATGQPQFEMFASSENEFFLRIVDARITFNKASDGTIESMILHQNGQDMPGKKTE